jgi:hypothetical protein
MVTTYRKNPGLRRGERLNPKMPEHVRRYFQKYRQRERKTQKDRDAILLTLARLPLKQ